MKALPLLFLAAAAVARAQCPAVDEVRAYIHRGWTTLQRSNASAVESALDSKVKQTGQVVIWVAPDEDPGKIERAMKATLPPADAARLTIRKLTGGATQESGLLYLPEPYVVPGGRFNEMYGWDSYFILLGLLRDGQTGLARSMTNNFLYEVQHYGKVLNANRTYYLTRSQPPFLSRMVLDVYRATGDTKWLRGSLPALRKYYDFWVQGPHLTAQTGLSRYDGGSDQPAPEVVFGERDDAGKNHYDRVIEYYRTHEVRDYDVARFFDKSSGRLTPLFYEGDRAMRESGFDPSARFGPFSVDIISYNEVALNSLLYRMESDLAAIETLLDEPREAALWTARATRRGELVRSLMWDPGAGLFFDYDFVHQRRSQYPFLTTFYPLWAGLATPEQAEAVAARLPLFEKAGGLQTSTRESGSQWDAPFGWAPLQLIAIEGLRRYGRTQDADRLSAKFLAMITADFARHMTIKEKYDVVQARSDLGAGIKFGYTSNEIGFGWTNAAFEVLYDELPAPLRTRLCDAR